MIGSTEVTPLEELVALGRKHGVPVFEEIGSGGVSGVSRYGVQGELTAGERIRRGADLVMFSGDKLLGGPQCGLVVGRRSLIETIITHPRMRAVRVDKLRLAALAATLRLHQDPDLAERSIPVLSLLATPLENLRQRAERLAAQIAASGVALVEVIPTQTHLSTSPLPNQSLPSISLALSPQGRNAEQLSASLRSGIPSVVGRIQEGKLLLDLRSVPPCDDLQLIAAIEAQRVVPPPESPIINSPSQ
jgi:L-seryl-tRNA(Ser) seleniumtransferase